MRIQFSKREYIVEPIFISGQQLEIVKSAKVLGMTLTDDLKWNKHTGTLILKAGVNEKHLINACIRSVVEYACDVFHSNLSDKYIPFR